MMVSLKAGLGTEDDFSDQVDIFNKGRDVDFWVIHHYLLFPIITKYCTTKISG